MYEDPGSRANAPSQKHLRFERLQKLIACDRRRCSLMISSAVYAHFQPNILNPWRPKYDKKGTGEVIRAVVS